MEFNQQLFIHAKPEILFAFFMQPENLLKISPGHLNMKIVQCTDYPLKDGAVITYRLKVLGFIPVFWTSKIENVVPDVKFTDIQVKGPFALWKHTHSLKSGENGTWVLDKITYNLPFGKLGLLVGKPFVKKMLKDMFEHRNKSMLLLFPA
jgi:ligand-binding SRPBCC domain-containing protein